MCPSSTQTAPPVDGFRLIHERFGDRREPAELAALFYALPIQVQDAAWDTLLEDLARQREPYVR